MNQSDIQAIGPGARQEANNQSIDLAAAWAGLIGVVLFVVGSLLGGSPPKPDASASQITTFLVQ